MSWPLSKIQRFYNLEKVRVLYSHEETYGEQLKDGACKNGRFLPSLASLLGIYKPQYCRESLKTNRQLCERINKFYSDNCNILCAVLGNIWSSDILIVSKQNWCHFKAEPCNGVHSDIPKCFCWLDSVRQSLIAAIDPTQILSISYGKTIFP